MDQENLLPQPETPQQNNASNELLQQTPTHLLFQTPHKPVQVPTPLFNRPCTPPNQIGNNYPVFFHSTHRAKRTRAQIATPQRPGTFEAQLQEENSYIDTPSRAPSSSKRANLQERPVSPSPCGSSSTDVSMRDMPVRPPPKFVLPRTDPDVLYAASIPLPETPENQIQKSPAPDFYIPTDWLMNPRSAKSSRLARSTDEEPESPLGKYQDDLIPVTPANQRLLDSLEIQWASPGKVPKYGEQDMEELQEEYETKLAEQKALADKEMADKLAEMEASIQKLKETHGEEIRRRDEDTRIQETELTREISNLTEDKKTVMAERDELRSMLDEYLTTSTKLLEEKEGESLGLSKELTKLTLERQKLQEQVEGLQQTAETLGAQVTASQKLTEELTGEKGRLEGLVENLRNDVVVAEERTQKIKQYAEETLAKANEEISGTHEQLSRAQQELVGLRTQAAKADAKARSLQIQLDSTKRQNQELLELCEGL